MHPKHQHYVPRLLLRGFLTQDSENAKNEKVNVLDLQEERSFTTSIDNIMGEGKFNDFWIDEETQATIEPATTQIEDYIATLIQKIRSDESLEKTPEEHGNLAFLMALQFIRTKKMRLLPDRMNQQVRKHVRKMGFKPDEVSGLEHFTEERLKKDHVRNQIRNLGKFAEIIAEKEMFLMTSPEGSSFYLGDHPVVLHSDEKPKGIYRGLGIGTPYTQIYLPLSARVMLCAYDRAVLGQLARKQHEDVKEIQSDLLSKLRKKLITVSQMRQSLDALKAVDITTPLIHQIKDGQSIEIGTEQVQHYNSLQAFQAQRFVVDPDNKFSVALEMIPERKRSESEE